MKIKFTVIIAIILIQASFAIDQNREWDLEIAREGKAWNPVLGELRDIVRKQDQSNLPEGIQNEIEDSNNCLSIARFQDKLFLGWRTAPYHFASSKAKMFLMSSEDEGKTWVKEFEINLDRDMREPFLLEVNETLFFYFFQAGTNPVKF